MARMSQRSLQSFNPNIGSHPGGVCSGILSGNFVLRDDLLHGKTPGFLLLDSSSVLTEQPAAERF